MGFWLSWQFHILQSQSLDILLEIPYLFLIDHVLIDFFLGGRDLEFDIFRDFSERHSHDKHNASISIDGQLSIRSFEKLEQIFDCVKEKAEIFILGHHLSCHFSLITLHSLFGVDENEDGLLLQLKMHLPLVFFTFEIIALVNHILFYNK